MLRRTVSAVISIVVLGASVSSMASAAGSSTDSASQRVALTRIYRGDDGGVLYLRQVSGAVYGFGEHPGSKYAYVLTGTISGDRITGKCWDVPKGSQRPTSRGTLQLRFTQGGARVVRSGGTDLGPDTFTAISASGNQWAVQQLPAQE